jgi:hypothetical protein
MIYAIVLILLAALPGPGARRPAENCESGLAGRITPARPISGRNEVCTTPDALEDVLRADVTGRGVHMGSTDAVDPLDAFGTAGPYDRLALSRLYGSRRARVTRGWSGAGHDLVSTTYVSPYPGPTFTTLEPGTLIIRYVLETRGL